MDAYPLEEVHKLIPILQMKLGVLEFVRNFTYDLGHTLYYDFVVILKNDQFEQIRHEFPFY